MENVVTRNISTFLLRIPKNVDPSKLGALKKTRGDLVTPHEHFIFAASDKAGL
jgi:hypothetical protein